MTQVVVSDLADADLTAIIGYLAREAGMATALRYAAAIDQFYDRIADFLGIGTLRPALGPLTRIGIVPPTSSSMNTMRRRTL